MHLPHNSHLLSLLLVLCVASRTAEGADLTLCSIPPESKLSEMNCECLPSNASNCNGVQGLELICRGLDNFYFVDAQYVDVKCLKITNSKFRSLNSSHFLQFPNLEGIQIQNNALEVIRPGALDHLQNLRYLNLDNNMLTMFPTINFINKLTIIVNRNLITSVDTRTFANLPGLLHLEMEGNRIEVLPDNVFDDKCFLNILSLSHNPLRTIESEGFTGAEIRQLYLIATEVSELPTTKFFREHLEYLDLDRTYNFKAFDARDSAGNTTFPLLEEVTFPYHAHCCQLKRLGIQYQDIPLRNSTNGTVSPTPQSDPVFDIVSCVNHTSEQILNNVSSLDLSDPLAVTIVNSTLDFCASCEPCLRDLDMCSDICAGSTDKGSGMNVGGAPVTCLERTTVRMDVNRTRCPSPSCEDPSCNVTQTEEVRASCTGILTGGFEPPPVEICDSASYCGQLPGPCTSCASKCLNHEDLNGCDDNIDPNFCSCLRDNTQAKCNCNRRKKRSASFLSPYEERVPISPDYSELAAVDGKRRRVRRNADTELPCSQNDSETFLVNLKGFVSPVTCRELEVVVLPTSNGTSARIGGVCPTPQDVAFTVEIAPVTCYPGEDPFNPCSDLLGESNHLRIAIWFVIIISLIGNALVFIVFIGYSVIIRKGKQDIYVVHFLYFNLAVADFLMGVYLLIIAVEDASTIGNFSLTDIKWRTGAACGFAGFCAITSTVVSVFVLMVITFERTYTIVRVLSHKKLNKKKAGIAMVIGWALGIFVASLPLFYFSDYSSVAICLPFQTDEPQDLAYVVILLLSTGLSFLAIAICYSIILQQILCNRRKSSPYQEARKRLRGECKVAIRIFILVFTNLVCWFPIAFVGLSAAFGKSFVTDLEFARWAIVFIFPINSCLNPILYSFTTRAFRENFVLLFNKCGLFSSKAQNIRNAQAGVSYTSKASDTSGINRVRSTVVMRFRSLSISSQSSVTDLLHKLNHRRASTLSQTSEENQAAYLNSKRRHSTVSNDSNKDKDTNLSRARSDSTFSGESDEALINPGFRTSSPEGIQKFDRSNADALRGRCKVSASSLGAVPEEMEIPMEVIGDQNMVKVNPAFCEDDEEAGERMGSGGVVTRWEETEENRRDSGCVEGSSENDDGSGQEVVVEVSTYQLQTRQESSPA